MRQYGLYIRAPDLSDPFACGGTGIWCHIVMIWIYSSKPQIKYVGIEWDVLWTTIGYGHYYVQITEIRIFSWTTYTRRGHPQNNQRMTDILLTRLNV